MNFDGREAGVTSEGWRRGWVSIAMSWDSIFGDRLSRREWRLGGRKRGGDVVGGLDYGDGGGSGRDLMKVGSMLMGFGMGWTNRQHWPGHAVPVRECDGGPGEITVKIEGWERRKKNIR